MKARSPGIGKTLAYILAALLVGLVIGNSNMKADLRHARFEIERLNGELAKRSGGKAGLNGITSMLRLPETSKAAEPEGRKHHHQAHTNRPAAVVKIAATNAPSEVPEGKTNTVHSMSEQLKLASDLWKTRSELARNSFLSNVTASGDQAVQFDVAMAAMNLRLSNSIRTWVETIKAESEVSPEAGIRILNGISGDLLSAYKDLEQSMPPGWRTRAGAKFAVFDFIDPDVALPLTEVEGKFKSQEADDRAEALEVSFP